MEEHLTRDGFWKESPSYHRMPVGALLKAAVVAENNGIPVFKEYPRLFQASYAPLGYSFPNLRIMGFGDIGHWGTQSPQNLEIAIRFASKYGHPALPGLVASLNQLIEAGEYDRSESGWFGLLTYLSKIPETDAESFEWDRTMKLDFAKMYGHRNGTDPETGLMYYVQGATYNHNHANGMAMELYGRNYVMGADPGTASYDEKISVNYYAVFGAHNTVIAAGASEPSKPFTGSGGAKHMGEISLSAMEPTAEQKAVSPYTSFVETSYREPSTQTDQQRTLGGVRTSEESGYYVDFFRSDNEVSNDYLYHNIGDTVTLSNSKGRALAAEPGEIPFREGSQTGIGWFENMKTPVNATSDAVANFRIREETGSDAFMQMHVPLQADQKILAAEAPRTRTAPGRLRDAPTPVAVIHQEGPAWEEPFAVVYEPYRGKGGASVSSVRALDTSSSLAVLQVENKDSTRQFIMQSDQPETERSVGPVRIKGRYGVISVDEKDDLKYVYLGEGKFLKYRSYSVQLSNSDGAVFVNLDNNTLTTSSHTSFTMTFPSRITGIVDRNGNEVKVDADGNQSVVHFGPGMNRQYRLSRTE
jgi:hypothetical protein